MFVTTERGETYFRTPTRQRESKRVTSYMIGDQVIITEVKESSAKNTKKSNLGVNWGDCVAFWI